MANPTDYLPAEPPRGTPWHVEIVEEAAYEVRRIKSDLHDEGMLSTTMGALLDAVLKELDQDIEGFHYANKTGM